MSLEADNLVDRRRLRGKLTFWRVLSVGLGILAVAALGVAVVGRDAVSLVQPQVARVTIQGVITGDRPILKLFEDLRKSSTVRAVIVQIDSPGGTVPGSEAIHDALRTLAAAKPTVAVVNTLAASGGYIAAIGADRIFARRGAVVGSVGVIFQYPNVTRLLDSVGVQIETVKSTPLKAAPSPLEPTTPEAREAVRQLVADSYEWFKTLVQQRRELTPEQLASVADGRVFTGAQALSLKMIDEIGAEREAIAWLEKNRNVPANLPIRDWRRSSSRSDLGLVEAVVSVFWHNSEASFIARALRESERLALDGLVAIWQPATEK